MSIPSDLYPVIVRIVCDDDAIGGGVLLDERRVATCAHVVDAAIPGRTRGTSETPSAPVTVEFPSLGNRPVVGRVVAWSPYRQPLGDVCDIAIIELDEVLPEAAAASRQLDLGVASRHCGEAVYAYGFSRRREGSTIDARLKSTRIGDDWLEIAGGSARNYFFEKGVSGAGVFSEKGYLLGLACAVEDLPLEEALAIPIAAVNTVLSNATLANGGESGDADLRYWIRQLQSCAERAVRDGNNLGDQIAEAMRAHIAWVDHGDDDEIARLQTIHGDLCALQEDVEVNLLSHYFEIVPLGMVLHRLQRLARLPERAASVGKRVGNLRADDPSFFADYIEPLIAEIDAALRFLDSNESPLDATARQSLSRDLKRLCYLVSALSYDLGEIDQIRARLERARDLLSRTIMLTQVLLGQHLNDLPDLAVFRDRGKDDVVAPEMVIIPAGRFVMGSPSDEEAIEAHQLDFEGPQHEVRVPQRFALGRYPVIFDEYDTFAKSRGHRLPNDLGWGRGQRPVINVWWEDAQAYVAWLTEITRAHYRLPAEAEWEYACRAGTNTTFHFGRTISTDQANYDGNFTYGDGRKGLSLKQTVEVGSFPPNAFGLYDMHGNVWEWCLDTWDTDYHNATPRDAAANISGGGDEHFRAQRGGSWRDDPKRLRSACRKFSECDDTDGSIGFRVARTLG